MIEIKNIPKYWQIKKLGEVCEIRNGKNQKQVINPSGKYPIYGSAGVMGFADEYLCEAGSTIVGRKGTINKPLYSMTQFWNVDTAFGFSPNTQLINSKFLFFFCLSFNFNKLDKSTTIPSLAKTDLQKIEVILPPIDEQQAIVAKIEELLSDLENGKQQLQTAQQQLKIYRQSLLKWAFEGKLTNKKVKDGELPKGWKWVKSGELFNFVTSGSRGWAKYYSNSGAIFIRITNLDFNSLKLDLDDAKIQYVNPPLNSEGLRTKVQEGDFLFSITGYLGMFAIAPNLENAFVNQHVSLCRPKDGFNKKYVGYWIISKSGGHYHLNKNQKGAVKAGLNLDDLKNFPVPIASIEEQKRIVDELESKLTICDKIEETISHSLQQAETLRQSILKKAFEGQLVEPVLNEKKNVGNEK